nr:MAG TPA: hypothetical protein [Herelleviridae sp.]
MDKVKGFAIPTLARPGGNDQTERSIQNLVNRDIRKENQINELISNLNKVDKSLKKQIADAKKMIGVLTLHILLIDVILVLMITHVIK